MRAADAPVLLLKKSIILVVTAAMLIALMSGCGEEQKQTASSPPEVEVAQVVQKDVNVTGEWVGTTDGSENAKIQAQVEGYIIRQAYTEGQLVKRGQLLFEIDPRTFRAAVQQAKADLAQRQAIWETAKLELARTKPLAERNAVSKKDLDDAVGAELSARAEVEAAKAALAKARLDLGFTRIASPIDGIAGISRVGTGDLVGPGRTEELATVSKVDPIKAYIFLSEQEYLRFAARRAKEQKRDRDIRMTLSDGTAYPHRGTMSVAEREVDPKTGTIKVVLVFPNPGNILRPGQYAKITAVLNVKQNALLVPERAITELQGRQQAAVVGADNTVHFRTVKASDRVNGLWVIDEGLKPGERVVTEGVQMVKENMVVRPIPFSGTAAGGTEVRKEKGNAAGE
jgi:membrane fusion protein (multidrug efflux system)